MNALVHTLEFESLGKTIFFCGRRKSTQPRNYNFLLFEVTQNFSWSDCWWGSWRKLTLHLYYVPYKCKQYLHIKGPFFWWNGSVKWRLMSRLEKTDIPIWYIYFIPSHFREFFIYIYYYLWGCRHFFWSRTKFHYQLVICHGNQAGWQGIHFVNCSVCLGATSTLMDLCLNILMVIFLWFHWCIRQQVLLWFIEWRYISDEFFSCPYHFCVSWNISEYYCYSSYITTWTLHPNSICLLSGFWICWFYIWYLNS